MNKLVALFALSLVLVTVVGCRGPGEAPVQPGTPQAQPEAPAPTTADAEVDAQLADDEDVEIGEIV